MPRLLSGALFSGRNGRQRMLTLAPYLSLVCVVVGVAWLFMLPLDGYSRRTYISENALLPGQVHTYFGGSDQNILRAYRREVSELENAANSVINNRLEDIFNSMGLKVGRQNYTYQSSGRTLAGENVYAILHAPRGDATEALVLVAAWRNVRGEFNRNGLALALTLTRYFKRWSLWSKDIIVLVPPESRAGTQAWVDAYHDDHNNHNEPNSHKSHQSHQSQHASAQQQDGGSSSHAYYGQLPRKSGALQGALALDYPHEDRFEGVHVVYDGVNGQLPNLDLINSIVNIASGQMGMGAAIQEMRHPPGSADSRNQQYRARLQTMLRGMVNQGLGHAAGPHSAFIPYHVDAVTIQPMGNGWHDEMGLGRLVEGTFRSLNNLLEHLHQSFFFYLLMSKDRFVSIGTYLPSAMLVAANFTIMAISLWLKSGDAVGEERKKKKKKKKNKTVVMVVERNFFLPLGLVVMVQFGGFVPLFMFNHAGSGLLVPLFLLFTILTAILPHLLSRSPLCASLTTQQYQLLKCFSLLLLGMFLSALATLNFSLALLVGLLASPLSLAQPVKNAFLRHAAAGVLTLLSPPVVMGLVVAVSTAAAGESELTMMGLMASLSPSQTVAGLQSVLEQAAFGWGVWAMYTPLVVWAVWWPAWVVAVLGVLGVPGEEVDEVDEVDEALRVKKGS